MLHRPALLGASLCVVLAWPSAVRSETPSDPPPEPPRAAAEHPKGWKARTSGTSTPAGAAQGLQHRRLGAEALSDDGAKLMGRGEFEAACRKYDEAAHLDLSPARLLTLASCHERSGKVATAWATFGEAAELADARGEPKKAALARETQKRLAASIGRLKVMVPDEAQVDDLVITRDGAPLARSLWGLPVAIDPGPHVIRVTALGRQSWQVEVGLMPGPSTMLLRIPVLAVDPERAKADEERRILDRRDGTMSTRPPLVAAYVPERAVDVMPDDETIGRTQRTLGLVLAGTGVTAFALGAAFSLSARSTRDELDATCTGNVCPSSSVVLYDKAQMEARRANLTLGIGLVALASGAVVYFSAPSSRAARTGRADGGGRFRVAPSLGPGEAALVAAGQF